MDLSRNILLGLIKHKGYAKKVFPHLKKEYFSSYEEGYVFNLIKKHIVKYKELPTPSQMRIELADCTDINESVFKRTLEVLDSIDVQEFEENVEWLTDKTEEFCKDRALQLAVLKAVELIEEKKDKSAIPEMMREALGIHFSDDLGLEFLDDKDIERRWQLYHEKMKKFKTDIPTLDKILGGGFEPKSLNCFLAGTNVGKTFAMIALTANMLRNGNDVLYVTLEMAESKITQRYEANTMGIEINDVAVQNKNTFLEKLSSIKNQGFGRLIVKEFPPASINVDHIRSILTELEIKKGFRPEIIVVDYLNLMNSSRYKGEGMYTIIKGIAEELRGLAVEGEYCILTATQGNREMNSESVSDADMTNTSESIGLPAVLDFFCALMYPKDLRDKNIQIWKALKNRYSGIVYYKFPIKVDIPRATLYDGKDLDLQLGDNKLGNELMIKEEERRSKHKEDDKTDDDDFDALYDIDKIIDK